MKNLMLLPPVGPASFVGLGLGAEVFYRETLLNRYWWLERGTGIVVGCPDGKPFCVSYYVLVEWKEKPGVFYPVPKEELEVFYEHRGI